MRGSERLREKEVARPGGRIQDTIDEVVLVPVGSTALYQRFTSRGEADSQGKLLSAMHYQFGGQGAQQPVHYLANQ